METKKFVSGFLNDNLNIEHYTGKSFIAVSKNKKQKYITQIVLSSIISECVVNHIEWKNKRMEIHFSFRD